MSAGEPKRAIVTGGSRGIGARIALSLAAAGYDLAISHWDGEGNDSGYAAAVAGRIASEHGRACRWYSADFRDSSDTASFIEQAIRDLGGVDAVVNNAFIPIHGGSILDVTDEDLDGMLNSYLRANIVITREAARNMVQRGVQGSIVNITSGRSFATLPGAGLYGGLKAAITHGSRSFALDLAPYGIRVNCVAPGYIKVRTVEELRENGRSEKDIEAMRELEGRVPLGRVGAPEDIANAVIWLISEQASYVTGASLTVDGGFFLPGQREGAPRPGDVDLGWTYFSRRTGEEWPRVG